MSEDRARKALAKLPMKDQIRVCESVTAACKKMLDAEFVAQNQKEKPSGKAIHADGNK